MRETIWKALTGVAAGLALGALAAAGGCVSYASYPAVARDTALNDPNTPALEEVMVSGLKYVVEKYPPPADAGEVAGETRQGAESGGATLALNLPQGLTPTAYERVARHVGHGAAPLTADTSHLPIYHVSYMRVRGDQAQINIVRPVLELGLTPSGTPVMQEIKLQLRGGLQPWHVISSREWDPGLVDLPPLSYHTAVSEAELESSHSPDDVYRPTAGPRPVWAPVNPGDAGAQGEAAPRQ
jgi:hypothetical protein